MGKMEKGLIVGLAGAARSGKDTAATILARLWAGDQADLLGVKRIQISGPLKAYLRDIYDWTEEHTDGTLKDVPDERYPKVGMHTWIRSPEAPTYCGSCGIKVSVLAVASECITYLTPRQAMQWLGGEFAEATFPPIYALRAARAAQEWDEKDRLTIITDLRFTRDLQAVKDVGGKVVLIDRAHHPHLVGKAAQHPSEHARYTPEFLSLVDYTILSDSDLKGLNAKLSNLLELLS